jgi:hypothetical protein
MVTTVCEHAKNWGFPSPIRKKISTHAHGVPLIAKTLTGTLAITLIGPNQFMPASNPVPSGTATFVGSALAFHTLSGAKFTVTYSLDATANTPLTMIR